MAIAPRLQEDGAELALGAAVAALPSLEAALAGLARGQPGIRLHNIDGLIAIVSTSGIVGSLAAQTLGPHARPVRAILFEKTADTNWALGWHQDRTIAVDRRIEVPGFGPWTRKAGMIHVEPPFTIIESMITLRVHLDAVPVDNAPLLIARGSHTLGRIDEPRIGDIVERLGEFACCAERGDVWVYATPILHASDRSTSSTRRRVLQIDYAAGSLPGGLEWLGI